MIESDFYTCKQDEEFDRCRSKFSDQSMKDNVLYNTEEVLIICPSLDAENVDPRACTIGFRSSWCSSCGAVLFQSDDTEWVIET